METRGDDIMQQLVFQWFSAGTTQADSEMMETKRLEAFGIMDLLATDGVETDCLEEEWLIEVRITKATDMLRAFIFVEAHYFNKLKKGVPMNSNFKSHTIVALNFD